MYGDGDPPANDSPYNSLQRSIEDFRKTLDSMQSQGVSRLAELAHLKVLVSKYPEDARQMLNEQPQSRTGNGL